MNPQDTVERVLKEIHIAFAKAETLKGQPNKIILDRTEFMDQIDRLTNSIYEMMERYEQTRQSRNTAERAFKRKSDEIIGQANSSADDIYAASIIYTAETLGRIRDLMDQTNESMNDLFLEFRKNLRDEKTQLQRNEINLQGQLKELSDSQKYLKMIRSLDKERAKETVDEVKPEAAKETVDEVKPETVKETVDEVKPETAKEEMPATVKSESVMEEALGETKPETVTDEIPEEVTPKVKPKSAEKEVVQDSDPEVIVEKPEIHINKNAEYFKWKAAQDGTKESGDGSEDEEEIQKKKKSLKDIILGN